MIACLIWWDERPDWLAGCVASVAPSCAHIVAIDGAYSLFPGATATSSPEQRAAIEKAAGEHGMGCTIHEPSAPWDGQEPEKRSFLFELAESVARPGDWLLSIDADEEVSLLCEPGELIAHLAATPVDVGTVHFAHDGQVMRRVHRAGLGWRAVTNHEFATRDGRVFGGDSASFDDREWLPIRVDHSRHDQRTDEDRVRKYHGYQLATAFNFYRTGPGPVGRVASCLRGRFPDGCGSPECPLDFRCARPLHWRDCEEGRRLEGVIGEQADEMRLMLARGPAWRERWVR